MLWQMAQFLGIICFSTLAWAIVENNRPDNDENNNDV
jgi:hypothetical protein